jgi:hypothetical protein
MVYMVGGFQIFNQNDLLFEIFKEALFKNEIK